MTDFANSNAKIDDIVRNSTNHEAMREAIKQQMVADGTIARDTETQGFGVIRLRSDEQTSDATLSAHGFKYERIFRYAPESGRRSLMLRANTLEDLQALEREMERTV